jgi:hypothetical protein
VGRRWPVLSDRDTQPDARTPALAAALAEPGATSREYREENEAWWAGWPRAVRRRVEERIAAITLRAPHPLSRKELAVLRNRLAEEEAWGQIFSFEVLVDDGLADPHLAAATHKQIALWNRTQRLLAEEWELLKHDPDDPLSWALHALLLDVRDHVEREELSAEEHPRQGGGERAVAFPVLLRELARPVPAAALVLSLHAVAAFGFGATP